jgi:hypothetical protein
MEEGGSIYVDRLGYISKIVQLLIEGFESFAGKTNNHRQSTSASATPDRLQSVVEEMSLPVNKVSLTEILANMIMSFANHKTRSIEVSRGKTEETQAVIFPPHTKNVDSFLDQARCSGCIENVNSEPHHHEACSCTSRNIGATTLIPLQLKSET